MRIVRFCCREEDHYGVLEGKTIRRLAGHPFDGVGYTGHRHPLDGVKLLAPVVPGKIIAVGLNYISHARELKMAVPGEPLIFLKPPSAVLGPSGSIVLPRQSARVEYEAELAVVIKKPCKDIAPAVAAGHILGFTCLNDVTARDVQARESQWARAKGFDTFCPIGPWIETDYDWRGKRVRAVLNGRIRQDATTDDFITPVEELVSYISAIMTLEPGDVISTGTPGGIGPMAAGDTIRIEIEGLGALENGVIDGGGR